MSQPEQEAVPQQSLPWSAARGPRTSRRRRLRSGGSGHRPSHAQPGVGPGSSRPWPGGAPPALSGDGLVPSPAPCAIAAVGWDQAYQRSGHRGHRGGRGVWPPAVARAVDRPDTGNRDCGRGAGHRHSPPRSGDSGQAPSPTSGPRGRDRGAAPGHRGRGRDPALRPFCAVSAAVGGPAPGPRDSRVGASSSPARSRPPSAPCRRSRGVRPPHQPSHPHPHASHAVRVLLIGGGTSSERRHCPPIRFPLAILSIIGDVGWVLRRYMIVIRRDLAPRKVCFEILSPFVL